MAVCLQRRCERAPARKPCARARVRSWLHHVLNSTGNDGGEGLQARVVGIGDLYRCAHGDLPGFDGPQQAQLALPQELDDATHIVDRDIDLPRDLGLAVSASRQTFNVVEEIERAMLTAREVLDE